MGEVQDGISTPIESISLYFTDTHLRKIELNPF